MLNNFVLRISLLALTLLASTSLHATPINPLASQYTIQVDNTVLSSNNTTFDSVTGTLTFTDATQTYTFLGTDASPLLNALTVARTCITLNLSGCSDSVVAISNANALYGTLQAKALVNVSLQATADANVSDLVFGSVSAGVHNQSAIVGYGSANASATPEPSSLVLLGPGILGLAGAARRRMRRP